MEAYRPGFLVLKGTLYVDADGEPVFGDLPELVCPLEHQLTVAGETEILK